MYGQANGRFEGIGLVNVVEFFGEREKRHVEKQ